MSLAVPRLSRSLLGSVAAVLALIAVPTALIHAQKPAAESQLDSLAWLAGEWHSVSDRGTVQELWMPPRDGLMLGLNRTLREGQPAQFEYLRIEEKLGELVLIASPGGGDSVAFKMSSSLAQRVVFANPRHDFPKRIEYKRIEEGRLFAQIHGDAPGPKWTFERVDDVH